MHFVEDEAEYRTMEASRRRIFRQDASLPGQVFCDKFTRFQFIEFDVAFSPEFWALLVACAERFGDSELSIAVGSPDPESYYFTHFGRYPAFRLPRDASPNDYLAHLVAEPVGSPADALMYNSRKMTWWGTSLAWGLWGEREFGVAVAATTLPEIEWPTINDVRWLGVDAAIEHLMPLNFKGGVVPVQIAQELRACYASPAGYNRSNHVV